MFFGLMKKDEAILPDFIESLDFSKNQMAINKAG